VVLGCTDTSAFNYDVLTNTDDGSCIAIVEGCTNPLAFNYNPEATTELIPSDCASVVLGCTDARYIEYNEQANVDDGSCWTLWVDLYADAIDELTIVNANNESLNYNIVMLENELSTINQILQDSVQFYESQILNLNVSYNNNLYLLESEILNLEINLSTTISDYDNQIATINDLHVNTIETLNAEHDNELYQLETDAADVLSQTINTYQLDSTNMVSDHELQLANLIINYNNQIEMLNAEDIIEDQAYEFSIAALQADSLSLEAQVASLQSDSIALETQVSSLGVEILTLTDQVTALQSDNADLEFTIDTLVSNIEDLNNNNTMLSTELNYYSAPILIDLEQGWNMIGFVLQEPMDVVASLEILGDKMHLIKNNSAQLYWPEFGFSNIEFLIPGQGYQVRMYEEHLGFTFPYIPGERKEISPTVPQWAIDIDIPHPNDIRTLVRVVNMVGQEVNPDFVFEGEILLYLYSDGSVEKTVQ